MRIIAGEFRSRRIKSVPGDDVRPTPDRLRESLFSILQLRIEGVVFLDAYAGTGAVGLEAVSRGASKAILIEKNREVLAALEDNVRSLGALGRAQVIKGSAHVYMGSQKADIVFIDPPYDSDKEYERAMEVAGGMEASLVIVQHDVRRAVPEVVGKFGKTRTVRQGTNVLSFYAPLSDGAEDAASGSESEAGEEQPEQVQSVEPGIVEPVGAPKQDDEEGGA